MKNYGMILAGGRGSRMNSDIPKQYMTIEERPVLYFSLKVFQQCPFIDEVILVLSKEDFEYCQREILETYGFDKVKYLAYGGKERYESVYNGLEYAEGEGYVFIHDGARPCLDQSLLYRLYEDVQLYGTAVAAVPSKDTIKIADADGFVTETPNRSLVWNVQTPQVFSISLIKKAYCSLMKDPRRGMVTDDAMVVENYGGAKIRLTKGDYANLKITTPEDFIVAKSFLKKSEKKM